MPTLEGRVSIQIQRVSILIFIFLFDSLDVKVFMVKQTNKNISKPPFQTFDFKKIFFSYRDGCLLLGAERYKKVNKTWPQTQSRMKPLLIGAVVNTQRAQKRLPKNMEIRLPSMMYMI